MRPLKLRMKGFGAFREETEVDLEGVELAALVGATGSGKSTIIDGVTFPRISSPERRAGGRLSARSTAARLPGSGFGGGAA